jgi:hypothetical protein
MLSGDLAALLDSYIAELADTTLAAETRRTYISRVRQYLAWLATTHRRHRSDADPLSSPKARDFAVRDYRRWLLHEGPAKRSIVYANSALTAIDDGCGSSAVTYSVRRRGRFYPGRWPGGRGYARSAGGIPSTPRSPRCR